MQTTNRFTQHSYMYIHVSVMNMYLSTATVIISSSHVARIEPIARTYLAVVKADGGSETQQWVDGEEKPFLLVRSGEENKHPDVDGTQRQPHSDTCSRWRITRAYETYIILQERKVTFD